MLKEIVVLGSDLAALSFLKWFRASDVRAEVTIITDSEQLGVPRRCLPWVACGLESPNDVPHFSLDAAELVFLSKVYRADPAKAAVERGSLKLDDEKLEPSVVVVSTGTQPRRDVARLARVSALNIKEAIQAREYIESWEGEVYVYGGFYGLNMVDPLEGIGLTPVICSPVDPFEEVFDSDVALYARRVVGELKIVEPVSAPKGQGIVFGLEEPRLPRGLVEGPYRDLEVNRNILVIGGASTVKTPLGLLWGIDDELAYKEGLVAALRLLRQRLPLPPPFKIARVRGYVLASCGARFSELSQSSDNITSIKISIKEGGDRVGLIKLVASRTAQTIVGFQVVVPMQMEATVQNLLALLALKAPIELLFLIPKYTGGWEIGEICEALWRKMYLKPILHRVPNSLED